MAATPQEMLESMKANLAEKTGKPFEHWVRLVQGSGLAKHGEQMTLLKEAHGIGHGYANMICLAAKGALDADGGEMLGAQYKGKEGLRPVYDALVAHASSFGPDVSIDPKKTSVAFRRSKNFAVVTPATKTRIDLGLNLKGEPGTDRLVPEKPGSMCTHKVRLETPADLDAELRAWLKAAYDRA